MLLGTQQVTLPRADDNEPVLESVIVVGQELHSFIGHAERTGFWEPRKWWHDVAGVVDNTFIRKTLPFEAAILQGEPVAFVRGARRLINAILVGAGSHQERQGD